MYFKKTLGIKMKAILQETIVQRLTHKQNKMIDKQIERCAKHPNSTKKKVIAQREREMLRTKAHKRENVELEF